MLAKITVFILIICILNLIKETIRFCVSFARNEKYESSDLRTMCTWASIAYTLTIIIYGIS